MDNVLPRVVFTVFGLPVRNTVVSTWIMMAMVVIGVLYVRKKAPVVLEMLIDFAESTASSFIGGPIDAYIPFLGSLVVFIAVANLIGVVPLMVTPTRDINTPLALALVVLVVPFAFGIKTKGIGGFIKGFFLGGILPLDLIGYVSRTMSLTLRLFGNILGGEIIVSVVASLVPVGVPLFFWILTGSITGILQAYVFTVLAASYINSEVGA
jgi:F-type H+-transporting ATPase subunit a